MRERLVPGWNVAVLVLINAPTLAATMSGDGMVGFQMQMVNDFGTALARLL